MFVFKFVPVFNKKTCIQCRENFLGLYRERDQDSRLRQTADVNLYHVTKFSLIFRLLFIASTQK